MLRTGIKALKEAVSQLDPNLAPAAKNLIVLQMMRDASNKGSTLMATGLNNAFVTHKAFSYSPAVAADQKIPVFNAEQQVRVQKQEALEAQHLAKESLKQGHGNSFAPPTPAGP